MTSGDRAVAASRSRPGSRTGVVATVASVLVAFGLLATLAMDRDSGPPVVLSELVASNSFGAVDGWGDHPDWVELHNRSDEVVDVGGWGLADEDEPRQWWTFPDDAELGPDERLVVFLSGRDARDPSGNLHTDFRLDREGEPVVLLDPEGLVVDRVAPVELGTNVSWGRDPGDPARWCRFSRPSPGQPNADVCWDDDEMGAPALSIASGFHDDPFDLEISSVRSGDEVWYTLDGSYPDPDTNPASTQVYSGPIRIEDRSDEPDRLSTISVSFAPGLVDLAPETPLPDGPVPKATVVRARSPHGAESSAVYWVGEQHRREDLAVVALGLDEQFLFDPDDGLFVPGRTFEEFRHGPDFAPDLQWATPANFIQRGRDWERPTVDDLHRPVWVHWCDPGGVCEYTNTVGVRVHGGATRTQVRKSIRLYARDELGDRRFEHPFFGDDGPTGHRRLILRNSGNADERNLFADAYFQSLMGHFEAETQASAPAAVYLNGEYWGIYNLRERHDQHYLELVHGADPDTVVIIDHEVLSVETGDPAAIDDYLRFLDDIGALEPGSPAARERIESTIDVDTFFDMIIAHVFVGNVDFAGNNVRAWRQPAGAGVGDDGPLDGRWRWMIVDLDMYGGGDLYSAEFHTLAERLRPLGESSEYVQDPLTRGGLPFLFQRLMADTEYRDRFLNRFADHLNTAFVPERTVAELDAMEELFAPEVPAHVRRWQAPPTPEAWAAEVDDIRELMRVRPGIQRSQLLDYFDLRGSVEVTVRHDPRHGSVRVNSVELIEGFPGVDTPAVWSGEYFLDVPIEFEAIPAEGYRFVRWEGVPAEMAEVRQLTRDVTWPMTLRAVFEPID